MKNRNITYIEKLLNFTEKYEIYWRLKEKVKKSKKKNNEEIMGEREIVSCKAIEEIMIEYNEWRSELEENDGIYIK
ncbi:hypothetical protein C1645_836791 [Glomus cerebriforme]|uniref:Uncharacterized protein n=1 Tax=Glomus cerebriforme TaxID=658196 RepID=A0A397S6F2_9GLOM|nr:hypothetical protein C1645_836791 [Glomus cerebriforme]